MYYLIYSSYAAIEFDDDKLKELLIQSRDKNKRLGVTGMLFYFAGKFMQLIEGEEAVIKELGEVISKDTRHQYFWVLKEGPIEKRFFEDWSMGFKSIDPTNFEDVEKFKELNDASGMNVPAFMYLLKILSGHS